MKRVVLLAITILFLAGPLFAADDVASAVSASVRKVDSTTKTFVVETGDGAEHTFHYTKSLSVHGAKDAGKTPEETLKGLTDGSKVAVHYTAKGSKETAHEVDLLGDDGLKTTEGTITHIDRESKVIAVKTADGSEETFRLTERAAKDSGKGIAERREEPAKVTVYYTEEAGTKIAHFFE